MPDNMPDSDLAPVTEGGEPNPAPEAEAAPAKPRGGLLAGLAVLLALAAIAATGWQWMTLRDSLQQVDTRLAGLERSQESTAVVAAREAESRVQPLYAEIQRLDGDNRDLQQSLERAYERLGDSRSQWSIEEIHQLLQLAVDQLALAGNISAALTALRIADRRITENGDPRLQSVREQIARDTANLQQIEPIDLAGANHRLQAVEENIDRLTLVSGTPATAVPVTPETPPAETPAHAFWNQLGEDLSGLVRIRRIDQLQVPLLPVEQAFYLRENIKAVLHTARIAMLRGETAVYRANLQQAADWISQHFDADKQAVRWTLDELTSLGELTLRPPLPDISGSLASLEAVTGELAR